MTENVFAGIVVTAQSFNPSIFTEKWLADYEVLAVDRLTGLRVFSPEVSQFQTDAFQVLVVPPKMQVTFSLKGKPEDLALPGKAVKRVVELLPHTPFQSLGLNFDFFMSQPESVSFLEYDRRLLGTGDYDLLGEFATADAKFGRYFSKDYGPSRLKLDVKPVKAGPDSRDLLRFSFNFHHDVSSVDQVGRSKELCRLIDSWDSVRSYAEHLVELGIRV